MGNLHLLSRAIEKRLLGHPPDREDGFEHLLPEASTYVLVLVDGLGVAQLDHPEAETFKRSMRSTLVSPFPTTTSVALATLATGMPPAEHGLTAHLMWMPELGQVVNTLKWVNLAGEPVIHDYARVLPRPNLWERLRKAGVEPITVQPAAFEGSPLSRLLYRGARFEPAWNDRDLVEATLELADGKGRLIFTYLWQVDFAGHVHGLGSAEFSEAMRYAAGVWDELAARLPSDAALIGTADHGLIEYSEEDKVLIRDPRLSDLVFAGDTRGVQVYGDDDLIDRLVALSGGVRADPADLFDGVGVADAVVLAAPGKVILPPGFDKRLRAYHGGLDLAEVQVPLMVG